MLIQDLKTVLVDNKEFENVEQFIVFEIFGFPAL